MTRGAIERIAVIGGGAWGTALAETAVRAGRKVTLWEHEAGNAESLRKERRSRFLPDFRIHDSIEIANEPANVAQADAILLVVPAQATRAAMTSLASILPAGMPVVVCAKGIEHRTHKFVTQIVNECAPAAKAAILSGPSFAADVARGLPSAVTLACADAGIAQQLVQALGSATFRPYHSTDVRGVEIGGATKNVLAIAAGIVAGRGLGASAGAALITRGFAELMRFGKAYDAKAETLTGLSGLGDLVLTCSTPQSRNFSFGVDLAKGISPKHAGGGKLAEGAFTAPVLLEMAAAKKIDMPISNAVAAVLADMMSVGEAIESLLSRPFRAE
jgi:glycerol-3-phosphate dehydrogenase (NAD(P)+)